MGVHFPDRCFRGFFATCRPDPADRFAASASRRRALSRDQPVTDDDLVEDLPFCFFLAFTYALAYLLVISAGTSSTTHSS